MRKKATDILNDERFDNRKSGKNLKIRRVTLIVTLLNYFYFNSGRSGLRIPSLSSQLHTR